MAPSRLLIALTIFAPVVLLAADDAKTKSSPVNPERSNKDQRSAYADLSKEKLQRQSEKLSDKRDAVQNEIDEFSKYILRTKAARNALSKAEPPNLENELKRASAALDQIAKLPPGTPMVNQLNSPGNLLISALTDMHNNLTTRVVEIVRPVIPGTRPVTGSRVLTPAEQVADEAASRFPDPRQTFYLAHLTPALVNLTNRLPYQEAPGTPRRSDLQNEIAAAQAESKELDATAKNFFDQFRKKYEPILEAVEKALQEAHDARVAESGLLEQQLAELEKELNTRAATVEKRQGTLTDNLLYTEALMLIAIIAAVFYLKVYPERLAITMVQEKTLGDLLGMGLLLITIIFLAAGEFVDKSALVTLLGTLAGYIFARRSPTLSREDGDTSAPLPAPTKLRQLSPILPGQISLSCDPVTGAAHYRWYTRPHGGKEGFVFRKQTPEPHLLLEGLTAGDSLDVTVSASNGREGKQSAPIQVTVT